MGVSRRSRVPERITRPDERFDSSQVSWETDQLDPPRRASRYFRHFGGRRSVHPDAFGMLRRGGTVWPFFLEWERRAVRPVTMAARLAPYLRYYSSGRPGRLRRWHRPDPLPQGGAAGDGSSKDLRAPAGLPPGSGGAGGAAGSGLARPGRRLRTGASPERQTRRTTAMRIYYIDESEVPATTSAPPWAWTPSGGTVCTA